MDGILMAYYDYKDLQAVTETWGTKPEYEFHKPDPNNVVCMVGATEMLKVGPDGFWVRGVKVPQDDKEAVTVYNAFKQFLVWSELNRR
jgi:hypothetical protein